MKIMQASAWKNCKSQEIGSTYGIRVGIRNREQYFDKSWQEIEVEIDGKTYKFSLTNGFWRKCPEFRDSKNSAIIVNEKAVIYL